MSRLSSQPMAKAVFESAQGGSDKAGHSRWRLIRKLKQHQSRKRLNENTNINTVDSSRRTSLHEAARAGSDDAVGELPHRGANIRAVDRNGRTALHEAAAAGSGDAVKELLNTGANIQAVDRYRRTSLHEAARAGSDDAVGELPHRGANIRAVDRNGRTALHEAAAAGSGDAVKKLLNTGANIQAVDRYGRTALHEAAAAGSGDAVKELLNTGANIQAVDRYGRTALHEAAAAGSGDAVKELLNTGANIQAVDRNGRTALHKAAAAGSVDAVKELLDRGANIRAVDRYGWTALHEAALAGSGDADRELLHSGGNIWPVDRREALPKAAQVGLSSVIYVNAIDNNGRTALHEAAQAGSRNAVKELLDRGANIQEVDKNGWTALHEAAAAGSGDAVKELLDRGANIQAVDRNGQTALHEAAAAGSGDAVKELLNRGANIRAADRNGQTALHEAAAAGSGDAVKELVLKFADIDMVDKNRRTAHDEIRPGSDEVIEIMLSPIRHRWKVNGGGATVHEECDGAIGHILTISKIHPNGHCYIARSVSEFLEEFYPSFGQQILDWINKVYKNLGDHPEKQLVNDICVTLSRHPKRALVVARLEPQQLTLMMFATSKELALEVKSALSWMFASLQPRGGREGLYSVTLPTSLDDWLPSMTKFSPTQTQSYCWMNLFTYACIALPSLDSLYHPSKEGLEIDFDLLVELAAVDRQIKTDVGIILHGFDTALIPLEPPESKCWHFLTTVGRQITPNRIKKDIDRLKLPARRNSSNQYNTGKVYVGWCDNPLVKIGTTESEPKLVEEALMTSGVPDVKKLEETSETASVTGLSLVSSVGFLGSALGISSGTKRQKMIKQVTVVARRTPTNNFEYVLDSACNSPYILWDNQTQRAWLLPAVSVLLFASLRYVIWKRYTFKRIGGEGSFKPSALRYAEPSTDAKRAALLCLRQNKRLLVEAADGLTMDGTDNETFFEDIVRDIWHGMSEGEDVCSSKITGRKYEPTHSLLGYDLQEAICGPRIHLRSLRILDFMKSWKPLAKVKQVQVVFCRNVGPVITCNSSGCSHACCEQQGTQGVLSCIFQDLKYFYGECWNNPLNLLRPSQPLPVGDNFEWVPPGSEIFRHLDMGRSKEGAPCTCCMKLDRLQSITEINRRYPKQKFKKSQSDNREQCGLNPFNLPSTSSLRFGFVKRDAP